MHRLEVAWARNTANHSGTRRPRPTSAPTSGRHGTTPMTRTDPRHRCIRVLRSPSDRATKPGHTERGVHQTRDTSRKPPTIHTSPKSSAKDRRPPWPPRDRSGSVGGSTGTRRLYGLLPAIGAVAAGRPLRPHSGLDRGQRVRCPLRRGGRHHLPQRPAAAGRILARRRDRDVDEMNVADPPLDLAQSPPLPNTGYVVVRGNPQGRLDAARLERTKLN